MKKYEDSSLEKIMKVMMEYNNSWDKEEFVR